ncbi:MAG TPA: PQQ-dependent sugar dehydrogenase, partial [Actinophytocola sp.]|uniref:PQQ-dependent sugar dehydrogenase n=1 Tax=Actinophytocola sp. TaxID=1872138 RepID=UPI002F936A4B
PNNAQNLNVLLGKILRIDIDSAGAVPCGQSTSMPYGIPVTNPFVGVSGCDEIWAYGVRNPWRFSFDRSTFDLLIGDVGQELYEEIDFQPSSSSGGENYGWHKMEGLHCYNPPNNCDDGSLTLPILEETHAAGWCAIVGGFRYRGSAIPGLAGFYVYGDLCLGELWAASESGGTWSTQRLLDPGLTISSFGQDEAGELYVADLNGAVYRLEPISNPTPTITSVNPDVVIAGDPAFTLDVFGSGFVDGSTVQWNGSDRPTTYLSGTHLTATISASDVAAAGIQSVTVFNPLPGGGTSAGERFDVNQTFLDVPTDYFAALQIQAIFNAGVTAGCDVRLFCPVRTTTRAEMAVFLLKSLLGPLYMPPACTPPGVFADVPCPGLYTDWIEDVKTRGITAGCGDGTIYCPDANVLRQEMAVFLLKTSQGSGYVPPACTEPPVFADVACPSQYADWIQDLKTRGITAGCGDGTNFCPGDPVLRAEMAAFLTITFNLPLP